MTKDSNPRTIQDQKSMWNALAEENDRYYVRSVDHEQSDQEYEQSGRNDVLAFVEADSEINRRLGPLASRCLLEIGCGSGRMTRTFVSKFSHVYAIDISNAMLAKARGFVPAENVTFIESSGTDVPVPAKSVDLAFSYIVYQHFPSRDAVLQSFRGVRRAVREDGLFKCQIRGLEHPDSRHWSWGPSYSLDQAEELARLSGFKIMEAKGAGARSFWLLLEPADA